LFEAWSVSILRLVVLWNVWKHVLHLTVWAAAFCMQVSVQLLGGREEVPAYSLQLALGLLGTSVALAVALLLCSVKGVSGGVMWGLQALYFAPLPMVSVAGCQLLGRVKIPIECRARQSARYFTGGRGVWMPGAILVYAKHGWVRHPRRCTCPLLAGTRSVPLTMWLSGLT
jgi:hypothetical protein